MSEITSEQRQFIIIDPSDNVATAIVDIDAGAKFIIDGSGVEIVGDIPFGHKFALSDIPSGEYVIKYGAQIGRTTLSISTGDHVHIHNVEDIVDEVRKIYA